MLYLYLKYYEGLAINNNSDVCNIFTLFVGNHHSLIHRKINFSIFCVRIISKSASNRKKLNGVRFRGSRFLYKKYGNHSSNTLLLQHGASLIVPKLVIPSKALHGQL